MLDTMVSVIVLHPRSIGIGGHSKILKILEYFENLINMDTIPIRFSLSLRFPESVIHTYN